MNDAADEATGHDDEQILMYPRPVYTVTPEMLKG